MRGKEDYTYSKYDKKSIDFKDKQKIWALWGEKLR